MAAQGFFFIETPLVKSVSISSVVGSDVYLKMENVHQAGSFKVRGISHLCQKAVNDGYTSLVCASGGSAGFAVAYAAEKLGVPVKVVVSKSTSQLVMEKIASQGAEVVVHGDHWAQANDYAKTIALQTNSFYVHPFDHPTVWEGHESMIVECSKYLEAKPSAVVLSVGGGGLACGVLQGMSKVGWEDVPLVAVETIGADCFNQSIKTQTKVVLDKITSIAVCLGSSYVCDELLNYSKTRTIHSEVVEDRDAVDACLKFADEHRALIDPACGAALAVAYTGKLSKMVEEGLISKDGPILIIVCGGCNVSLRHLQDWKEKFHL